MIGIVGGTGLYRLEGLRVTGEETPATPFGPPSAPVTLGELDGRRVAFLPRHGAGHALLPSEINYRANVWALKAVGVTRVVGVSAVGSLREAIAPGALALPTQYLDWTRGRRAGTFFGEGVVAHVSTAEPTCPALGRAIGAAAEAEGAGLHAGATYACVEGPRLGTRAESFFLRGSGCDLVGMTNVPEVFLAREAQLCYATVCVVTDYDCWQDDPAQHVSVEKIFPLYQANLGRVRGILGRLVRGEAAVGDAARGPCGCRTSLAGALLTPDAAVPEGKREYVAFLRR